MDNSKQLTVPDNEPWMSHAFISRVAAQVSLPYRRQDAKEIIKRNGTLEVRFATTSDCLPYGKYPRLFELWACTMIKSENDCWNPETRRLSLGSTFRDFLRLLNIEVGGRQLRTIKPQLERLFRCVYSVVNLTDPSKTDLANFVVAPKVHIEWLSEGHNLGRGVAADNWVILSKEYVQMLRDNPVPVDLRAVAQLRSPMSIDIYWWLTKRYYGMHSRSNISWQQLYDQFGSNCRMAKFKENFKEAVAEVQGVYSSARITCGKDYVTLWPSPTAVPTVAQIKRRQGMMSTRSSMKNGDGSHWINIAGWGSVWMTTEAFEVDVAREHLDGTISEKTCPVCIFDERNIEMHGRNALSSDAD